MPFMSISAQSEDSKNYLPEQGDMAFGINVKPVLKYVGNIFNGTTNNKLKDLGGEPVTNNASDFKSDILPTVSIMGKYMLSDNWGVRANVGLMLGKDTDREYVIDDKQAVLDPFNESKLIDTRHTAKNGMSLMLGAEYRKGSKRIQGVFGMGVLFGFYNQNISYDFANAVTPLNDHPTSASWVKNCKNGYRIVNEKTEGNLFYGITGSAGVEWFVAPKVSLGAEVNLSLYHINGGQLYTQSEGYNNVTQQFVERTDLTSPGNDKLRFGTENLGGSLYMAFYF
jgi:hypothetical protein